MSWSERVKKSWEIFSRSVGPLYGWTGIYYVFLSVLIFVILFTLFSHTSSDAVLSLVFGEFLFDGNLDPDLQASSIGALLLLGIVVIAATSAYIAGMTHLIKSGYEDKGRFSDFVPEGFGRLVLFQSILAFLFIFLFTIGILMGYFFLGFLIILTVIAVIFLSPWLVIVDYYLVLHDEVSMQEALFMSFSFFRENMNKLWGLVGLLVLIGIAVAIVKEISPSLGFIAGLAAGPFEMVAPVVWILSIEDEKNQPPSTGEHTANV